MAYKNTFISVAPDTKTSCGVIPKPRGNVETIPQIEYRLLSGSAYTLSQEELTFRTHLIRQGIDCRDLSADERDELWKKLFSKGQPCLRASALTKSNGWGVHYDLDGKIAIYPMDSDDYRKLSQCDDLKQLSAMRLSRR